jgi:hypothetical protein
MGVTMQRSQVLTATRTEPLPSRIIGDRSRGIFIEPKALAASPEARPSVLQEGRENANIHTRSGVARGTSV